MQNYSTDKIRSFALVGHGGAGKTSMAEALAYTTGLNTRLGSVTDGTSLMDFEAEEQKRGGSISTSYLTTEFDGFKFHVADTPGDGNFLHEARTALQAVDGVIVVVSGVDGVEVSTEQMITATQNQNKPRAIFMNKMDRDYVDVAPIIAELSELFGKPVIPVQMPIGSADGFRGVVDMVCQKAYLYDNDKGTGTLSPIPAEMEAALSDAREVMMDAIASVDDELIEKYLEDMDLSNEELRRGLHKALQTGAAIPVFFGSAAKNIGLDLLLEMVKVFPSAEEADPVYGHTPGDIEDDLERTADADGPFAALCVKTLIERVGTVSVFRLVSGKVDADTHVINARTGEAERLGSIFHLVGSKHVPIDQAMPGDIFGVAKLRDTHTGDTLTDPKEPVALPYVAPPPPMIAYTVTPESRNDIDKLKAGLTKLLAEDTGLQITQDSVSKELVLHGMGTSHVQISVEKLQRKYGVNVELGTPAIPYRETITADADVRYRHKKQTGGAGQFGEVAIRVRPGQRGSGFVFNNRIVGGVIPGSLIPSVDKGIREQLEKGILAGFQAVDVEVDLYDGKYHPVDSKDIAFQIAGRHAIKEAFAKARPVLLEPIYRIEVIVPEDHVGDIMGDMNTRRGRILNMDSRGRNSVVKALVPLAEMQTYAPDLRSMTGGKGFYTMTFETYERVPGGMQDKLVASLNEHRDDE
ncbi:MAG: elongation factor G [Deltaproteobacteria bacterium]|nr:elongation factor G [Deltaproteobacteria bacterium]